MKRWCSSSSSCLRVGNGRCAVSLSETRRTLRVYDRSASSAKKVTDTASDAQRNEALALKQQ